eukprot:jgi/Psemu1/5412/gm1.5412_g
MAILLKQTILVFVALLLAVSPQAVDAAIRGVRGGRQQHSDSIAISNEKTSSERNLKKKGMKCAQKLSGGRASRDKCGKGSASKPSGSSSDITGRLEIPVILAPTPAPAHLGPSLAKWIEGCAKEERIINRCTPFTNSICKNCLFGLSLTSVTPRNANSGVNACAREFCKGCSTNELMSFFDCGRKIDDPNEALVVVDTVEGGLPGSEIRTPPPTPGNTTEEAEIEDDEDDGGLTDVINCPAIYPRSGTECTMIDGFEYKLCSYFELGPDVVCQCSKAQTIWSCTGTITRNPVSFTQDIATSIQEENQLQLTPVLPGSDIVVSRIEDSDEKEATPLCPVERPYTGTTCTTGGFHLIECCYPSHTLGTIACRCDGENWGCKGGSLSTCKL